MNGELLICFTGLDQGLSDAAFTDHRLWRYRWRCRFPIKLFGVRVVTVYLLDYRKPDGTARKRAKQFPLNHPHGIMMEEMIGVVGRIAGSVMLIPGSLVRSKKR
jgi:hypothetical protein